MTDRSNQLMLTFLGLAALALSACGDDETARTCTIDGVEHQVGDRFPASDGCNTCTCGEDGQAACTLLGCVTPCTYDGVERQPGSSFPATDGCNTCSCDITGQVVCTLSPCVAGCTYDRQTWNVGDHFPAIDGCNTCTCMEGGQVACTEIACPVCDAGSEWWREYFGHSPEQCAAIDFRCLEGNVAFANDCGCGCEQPEDCEREIDCFAPECDASVAAARCPYSTIDTTRDCSVELACPSGSGTCSYPGQDPGCGICFQPPEGSACADDAGCARGSICEPVPCACGGEKACAPGCGPTNACGEGLVCGAAGRCEAKGCSVAADCPANFRCDGGGCLRSRCEESESCAGYCVSGECYSQPGSCTLPVP